MERNKIIFNGEVLIDLTTDTAEQASVLSGKTFHDKTGAKVAGTCTYDADTKDATALEAEILTGKTAYKNGTKLTGKMPNNGAVNKSISNLNPVTIDYGFHDGSGTVGIDANEVKKLVPGNIRKGVSILSVVGNMEEGTENPEPTRTVTPTASRQSITPATGYTCLREVIVEAIPYKETQNASGITVTIG